MFLFVDEKLSFGGLIHHKLFISNRYFGLEYGTKTWMICISRKVNRISLSTHLWVTVGWERCWGVLSDHARQCYVTSLPEAGDDTRRKRRSRRWSGRRLRRSRRWYREDWGGDQPDQWVTSPNDDFQKKRVTFFLVSLWHWHWRMVYDIKDIIEIVLHYLYVQPKSMLKLGMAIYCILYVFTYVVRFWNRGCHTQ